MERGLIPVTQPLYFDLKSQGEHAPEEGTAGLLEIWELLVSNKWIIIAVTLICGLAGLLFSLPQQYVYQARELIELQEINPKFLNLPQLDPNAQSGTTEAYVQNQVRILQSRVLRAETARVVRITAPKKASYRSDRFSEMLISLGLKPLWPGPTRDSAVQMASTSLKVHEINNTSIVELVCESTDPEIAASFAGALVRQYMQRSSDDRWSSFQQTSSFLGRQVKELREQLQKSESQMQDYARQSGLLVTSGQTNVAEEKLKQIQQELSSASGQRMLTDSRYQIAKASPPDTIPDVLADSTLRGYQTRRTDLKGQLAELSIVFKDDHYKIQQLKEQVAEIDAVIRATRNDILERMKNENDQSRMREQMLQKAYAQQTGVVSDQSSKLTYYNLLKREADTNRQLYDSMLQQVKEAGVASALRTDHARIIEPAQPPSDPSKPETAKNIIIGLSSGLCLGVAFVALRQQADRKLRDPGDGLRSLRVPALGVILSGGGKDSPRLLAGSGLGLADAGELDSPTPIELTTWSATPSAVAESFRGVLTSLLSLDPHRKVFVFTSPNPREGKTTVISNLAVSLAEIDKKVLLIDADLRKPRLHGVFGISNAWGLSDVISEGKAMDSLPVSTFAKETSIPNLRLLPSGPGTASIAKLLYSSALDRLLIKLREEYDIILIDTPPMLTIPDARVIARKSDGVVLVLRAGQTTKAVAHAAVERLMDDNIQIVGTVLNDWDPKNSRRSYYNSFYYYETQEREF
ncbi:MAG: polysaccharide biosynthesis tyrosine autokinase [Bryobacteraceae bacterium]|nr:polysaccharide biosynthesis tyrosine autokinase [Bryobacteraceae bacterium]